MNVKEILNNCSNIFDIDPQLPSQIAQNNSEIGHFKVTEFMKKLTKLSDVPVSNFLTVTSSSDDSPRRNRTKFLNN